VGTIRAYTDGTGLNEKLFACTDDVNNTLWDISVQGAVPPTPQTLPGTPPVTSFVAGQADIPGEWSFVQFNNYAGSYLCTLLQGNGYYYYNTPTGWVQVANGDGVVANTLKLEYEGVTYQIVDLGFIFSWKNRIWLLHKEGGLAWYLPVGQITGVATGLDLGQLLRRGGGLAYATSWTFDSGEGMDDNLVFVSHNGDMVVYEGSDPDTDFQLKGSWFVGRIPVGRRGFGQYAGDILIVTEFGVLSVSDLVSGKLQDMKGQSSVAPRYNPTLARSVSSSITQQYWQLFSYPQEELVLVLAPVIDPITLSELTYCMTHFSQAWSVFAGFPAYCAGRFAGQMIIGSKTGKVYQGLFGYRDGTTVDQVTPGSEIVGTVQTGFSDCGSPTQNKRAQRVKLSGRADGIPGYIAKVNGEYEFTRAAQPTDGYYSSGSLWDVGIWDEAVWLAQSVSFGKWFGVAGVDKKLAVQIRLRGSGYTLLTDYEMTFEEGIGL
jgi:hypothetical protein